MTTLVTLHEVKAHLRVTHTDEDAIIRLYMESAVEEIKNYINRDIPIVSGTSASYPVPIRAAALLLVSDLYENRDGASDKAIIENPAIKRLLNPYRDKLGV